MRIHLYFDRTDNFENGVIDDRINENCEHEGGIN